MSFPRRVEPELLDQLPADEPRAIRARRDVRRANTLMMNAGIMASALTEYGAGVKPRTIVDLGSGDGQFMLRVARRLAARWPDVTVVLQDKQDIVSRTTREAFAALRWRVETSATDVFDFLASARSSRPDIVTSNLFLVTMSGREDRALARKSKTSVALVSTRHRSAAKASRVVRLTISCLSCRTTVTSGQRAASRRATRNMNWPSPEPRSTMVRGLTPGPYSVSADAMMP